MRHSKRLIGAIALAMAGGSSCAAAPSMSFTLLGGLETNGSSAALGVSRDGTTVIGSASVNGAPHAFRWRADTGMVDITPGAGGTAHAVSGDGSVIVGLGATNAFRWSADTGAVSLGSLAGPGFFSVAYGVSADGRFATGATSTLAAGTNAFRYDHLTATMTSVGGFEGRAISDDGRVIAGTDFVGGAPQAFRWSPGGNTPLGTLGGGFEFSEPLSMTPDGSVIVGRTSSDAAGFSNPEAFRWTAETGMIGLGAIFAKSGEPFHTEATAVSADGSVIVGHQRVLDDDQLTAFLWTESRGMLQLTTVLSELGIDFGGADLLTATGVSGDGRTIVGLATTIDGARMAYSVTVPAPSAAVALGLSCLVTGGRRRR